MWIHVVNDTEELSVVFALGGSLYVIFQHVFQTLMTGQLGLPAILPNLL